MKLIRKPAPMNRIVTTALLSAVTVVAQAQTAINFNCNDCAGTPHDLFAELDAGKVVVLAWVMSCAPCVGPSLTMRNIVQSYQASDPGRVIMYLCDDYGNTSCSALNGWMNANGLSGLTSFSNPAINMTDYGGPDMPMFAVVGGPDHVVFFREDGTVDVPAVQDAIAAALSATAITEESNLTGAPSIHPVPATDRAWIDIPLAHAARVTIDLYDLSGSLVISVHDGPLLPGDHRIGLDTREIPAGMYVIRVLAGEERVALNLVIAH